jgi:tripartite-type tricarboxylate transporter receptor subunit TctC
MLKSKQVLVLTLSIALMLCLTLGVTQAASNYPSKPIRVIVNQAAGGTGDISTRTLVTALKKQLNASIIVENVTEAGGVKGVTDVYNAKPDGYTLLCMFLPRSVQQEVLLKPRYNLREMTPIANFRRGAFVLVVGKNSPYKDYESFLEASKKRPMTVGMSGLGSATHLQAVRLADVSGAKFEIVPFQGTAPAEAAVIGGHIDAAITPSDSALLSLDNLTILVTPTADRLADAPDVPSITEFGFEDAAVSFYQGIMAPPGLPEDIREVLEEACLNALNDPDFLKQWSDLGLEAYGLKGDELKEIIEQYYDIVEEYKDILQ